MNTRTSEYTIYSEVDTCLVLLRLKKADKRRENARAYFNLRNKPQSNNRRYRSPGVKAFRLSLLFWIIAGVTYFVFQSIY